MRYVLIAMLLLFLGSVGIFALQNYQTVTVKFLVWSITSSFAFLSMGIYILGMLSGGAVVAFLRMSMSRV